MHIRIPVLIATFIVTAMTSTAFAKGPGGFGGGSSMPGGGMSSGHLNPSGMQNSNGLNSLDRDKGLGRAEDRMNQEGQKHTKAGKAKTNRTLDGRSGKHLRK